MKKTHRSLFLKEVKAGFPEIRDELNSQNGLLHCEMHAFHDHIQSLIEDGDKAKVATAFQIVDRHFREGNVALKNAIAVSFLEHLDLGLARGEPSWAYEHLPESLKQPYEELRRYHDL